MKWGERMNSRIKLSKETREQMIIELRNFFLNERDEEIGDLASMLLLDFIVEKFGPVFYNQGIEDSIMYLKDKIEDLYGLEV